MVQVERHFDAEACAYTIDFRQQCPPTPGQPEKLPFHIPVAMALLDQDGRELPLRLSGENAPQAGMRVLQVCQAQDTFVFQDVDKMPVPSLLRGFSAPVRMEIDYTDAELGFLLAHDPDPFCRWEAGQQLGVRLLLELAGAWQRGEELAVPPTFIAAMRAVLTAEDLDPSFRSVALTLPGETYRAEDMAEIDPQALHAARLMLRRVMADQLSDAWLKCYQSRAGSGPYRIDALSMGRRSLHNLCLSYLMELEDDAEILGICLGQFEQADNMNDRFAALTALTQREDAVADRCLEKFYDDWQASPQVLDKWLAVQATSRRNDTLQRVEALSRHPAFSLRNPNKVYALLRSFGQANPARFHAGTDGAAYRFMAEQIVELDAINPQVAARLAGVFNAWNSYAEPYRSGMQEALQHMHNQPKLSPDLYEILYKSLDS